MDAQTPRSPRKPNRFVTFALRLVLLAVCLQLMELAARLVFTRVMPPTYVKIRGALMGKHKFLPGYQNTTDQAYLLYIPTPNMPVDGKVDHNSQGYRGKAVPMDRTPGVYRILCLGGSTTYGWCVKHGESAYPAQLERMLNTNPPAGYESVEVINAGAPYATSAEEFAFYHFKFHYYKPDLVIIHTGGNDAEGVTEPNYHPDYSNWRQAPVPIRPLPRFGRTLLHSRLLSMLIIPMLYGEKPGEPSFVRCADVPPPAVWYPRTTTQRYRGAMPKIPIEEYAFDYNTRSLIQDVKQDGAKVLLMPFREAPRNRYPPATLQASEFNRQLLEKYAREFNVDFAPFPAEAISPGNWADEWCHLNEAGCKEKARHLLPYVRRLIAK